jgi:hypothetical protein
MTSRTDKISAGNSRAAYMREYRKRKRLEEDNCNNVHKRTKINFERQRDYRKHKAEGGKKIHHKHLRQLTRHQLQLYTIIMRPMNTFKRIFGKERL